MPTCSLSRTRPTDHREAVPFSTIVDAGPCRGVDVQFTPRPCRSLSNKQQPHSLVRHHRRPRWSRSRERADSQVTFCKKREYSSNRRYVLEQPVQFGPFEVRQTDLLSLVAIFWRMRGEVRRQEQ